MSEEIKNYLKRDVSFVWETEYNFNNVFQFWNIFVLEVTDNTYNFLETKKEDDKFYCMGVDLYTEQYIKILIEEVVETEEKVIMRFSFVD